MTLRSEKRRARLAVCSMTLEPRSLDWMDDGTNVDTERDTQEGEKERTEGNW